MDVYLKMQKQLRDQIASRWQNYFSVDGILKQKGKNKGITPTTPLQGALYNISQQMEKMEDAIDQRLKLETEEGAQKRIKEKLQKMFNTLEEYHQSVQRNGLIGREETLNKLLLSNFPKLYSYIQKNLSSKLMKELEEANVPQEVRKEVAKHHPSTQSVILLNNEDNDARKKNNESSIANINDLADDVNSILADDIQEHIQDTRKELTNKANKRIGILDSMFNRLQKTKTQGYADLKRRVVNLDNRLIQTGKLTGSRKEKDEVEQEYKKLLNELKAKNMQQARNTNNNNNAMNDDDDDMEREDTQEYISGTETEPDYTDETRIGERDKAILNKNKDKPIISAVATKKQNLTISPERQENSNKKNKNKNKNKTARGKPKARASSKTKRKTKPKKTITKRRGKGEGIKSVSFLPEGMSNY